MRAVSGVALAVTAALALTACGSGTSAPAAAAPSGAGSVVATPADSNGLTADDMRVPAPEVVDGLNLLKNIVNDVANSVGSDPQAAADAQGRIEPVWSSIEGTVRVTEPATYRILEDQFSIIQKGLNPASPVRERAAADAVVKAADGYLARHAGTLGSSSPEPTGHDSGDSGAGSRDPQTVGY